NTFVGGDTFTNASFGLNYNVGSAVAANTRFYGGCIFSGTVPLAVRRKVQEYWMATVGFDTLKEQEYDIFCFIGQSNMMGVGDQSTATSVTMDRGVEYIDSG